MPSKHDAVVAGAGFFGSRVALLLATKGFRVLLVEKANDIMTRASFANQARVHNGYHYPRSVVTGRSSHLNYRRFVEEYYDCILSESSAYYAIARRASKTTASQFVEFCARIGAPISTAPYAVTSLFDRDEIEVVFEVTEAAMNADLLRTRVTRELHAAGVETRFGTTATSVSSNGTGCVAVTIECAGESTIVDTSAMLNCTYSATNVLLTGSGAPRVALKHELAEIALVEVPESLRQLAVTVVDGPFFSLTPFPPRGLHALTHVRYTPHYEWFEDERRQSHAAAIPSPLPASNADRMIRDAARYLPALRVARAVDSLWEIKTVMPRSETSDSRPILFRQAVGVRGLFSILGAKIDGIYDVEASLEEALSSGELGLQ